MTMPPTTETGRSDFFELMASLNGWDGLEAASNNVTDLIQEERLDEAEKAAHELLDQYPDVHDGYDYIGRVYETRGEKLKAAEYYRKAAAFIRTHPDHYELGFEEVFDQLVEKLDPFGLSRSDVSGEVLRGPAWRVAAVEALPGYQLKVRFNDGLEGVVDMDREVHSPDAGVFAELADPDRFAAVFVDFGAVTWPGEIDLAPDAMYAEIKAYGQWVL
jgi:tetratricopeptide (TPR) repeat protein